VERIARPRFIAAVKNEKKSRIAARAQRLEQEARNCIAVAIGQSGGFTAELIDEAVRLSGRARELTETARAAKAERAGSRTLDAA